MENQHDQSKHKIEKILKTLEILSRREFQSFQKKPVIFMNFFVMIIWVSVVSIQRREERFDEEEKGDDQVREGKVNWKYQKRMIKFGVSEIVKSKNGNFNDER